MRKSVLKRVLPPPYVCTLAAFLLASCSLIQEMPKEFMDTYGNIAHVEKVEYEGLAEGGGDMPLVTETRDFRIIYTISNTGDFDLAPEFSFEGCEAEIKKIETEKYRIALTVSGESLATLEDGAALKVKLLLYMAKQKILQSAYEIDMLYVRTGPPAEDPSNPGGTPGDVDSSNPENPSGGFDPSNPDNPSGGDPSNPNAPEEPDEPLPPPEPENVVYVRGDDAAWYEKNMPGAEASDENPGTEDAPFATIQRAVKEIIARNDGESVYAIYIDGTLECDARTYTGAQGMADFSALEKDLTLTIKAISETATLDAGEKSRVIYAVPSSGSLNLMLEKLVIKGGNVEDGDGGGIYASGAVITMRDDVTITGNKARFGGGVYVDNNGTFTIKGGIIGSDSEDSGNKASHGGGVYIKKGTLTMSGSSTISGNTAEVEGGGVYIASIGAFNMSGGEISKNKTNDGTGETSGGGGVYVYLNPNAGSDAQGTFTMTGGKVIENTSAKNGGGVYVNGGTFTMEGGTIGGSGADKNTAKYGGGVYAAGDSSFNMSGSAAISGNTATSLGGGVYVKEVTFTMKGGTIDGNEAIAGGGVYVTGSTFNMTGGTIGKSEVTGSGNTASGNGGGGVYFYSGKFNMSGGTIGGNETTGNGGAVYVSSSVPFTLSSTAKITSNTAKNGGGVYFAGTNFTMTGGSITGNAANGTDDTSGGGGVYLASGTFEMSGGTIGGSDSDKNTSTKHGGGVYVSGTFNMSGSAEISGNRATGSNSHGGGVYVASSGEFDMINGKISGNYAGNSGGGVYVGNMFEMSGGTISGNKTEYGYGGGVNVTNKGTFNMSGTATISDNTANQGGGVYISEMNSLKGTFEMTGGKIDGNTATKGKGVYVSCNTSDANGGSTFKMSGGAKVSENNDVYLGSVSTSSGSTGYAKITVADTLTAESPVATITLASYAAGRPVLSAGTDVTIDIDTICKQFDVSDTNWKIVPSGGYGVLASNKVSGSGITVETTWGDVYTFEIKNNSYEDIVEESTLRFTDSIKLVSIKQKDGTPLKATDGTFTLEIRDLSGNLFGANASRAGFEQPVLVPIVPYAMKAFVYVKAELKEGKTVETHIPVTIMP